MVQARGRNGPTLAYGLGIGVLLAASVALRLAFPIQAEGGAVHDDQLYVRLAESVRAGRWLGAYDNLTLAKGAGYPIFIALAALAGIPLKLAEHLVYLGGCLAFSWAVARLFGSRAGGFIVLAILALNPVAWSPESLGRVVREGLYIGLTLWIVALCVLAFAIPRERPLVPEPRRKWPVLVALGACGGIFWLTREEGAWLLPSILLFVVAWLWRERTWDRRVAACLAIPLLAFAAVVGAMNLANLSSYGVFRNNDFRSVDFVAAYGALVRIEHASPRTYVALPEDARRAAYAASAAARELAPYLEGAPGRTWREVGCADAGARPEACTEILSGWLAWALRDAVAHAGHYRNAVAADEFYRRLAAEIDSACEKGALRCGPRGDSLVPPWRGEYLEPVARASWSVARRLASLGYMEARPKASSGTAQQLARFERMTGGPLAGPGAEGLGGARIALASAIARAQVAINAIALPAAAIAWVGVAVVSLRRRVWHPGHLVVAALAAAMATRVALLGFLEATSFPADNLLYLTPVTPLALAFAPCVAFLAWRTLRPL